jgi:prepilin-type N-terminal cleavage/methylation domain-containing protein
MNKQRGFTLVELLVVIAIIAVLAGAVLLAINPLSMLQKSRDAKRLSDLETVSKAIALAMTEGEVTLTEQGPFTSVAPSSQAVDGTGWVKFTPKTVGVGLAKWIPALPVDPTNVAPNVYTFQSSATGFEMHTVLEHPDNLAKMGTDGGNDANSYEVGTELSIITPRSVE